MTHNDALLVLQEFLHQMRDSMRWLQRSYDQCKKIGIKESYTEEELDKIENLYSRFGRAVDLIVNKVFRSIDKVELEEGGTLLDVVNRAEKREIIESVEEIREMKDLRNQIVHEYLFEALIPLIEDVLQYTPKLFEIQNRVLDYCKQKHGLEF